MSAYHTAWDQFAPWDQSADDSSGDQPSVPSVPLFTAIDLGPSLGGLATSAFAPSAAAPAASASPLPANEALYIVNPGETTAINVADLHQGQIGDCFLISSIGEIAINDPSFISSMITQNANGTETVALHVPAGPVGGHLTFRTVDETVTNVFPSYSVNGQGQDVVKGVQELWPQVLEKAYAQLDGGYGAIADGGSPVTAMEELTGQAATWTQNVAGITASELAGFSAAKDLVVMDTRNASNLPDSLVANHAYMYEGTVTQSGVTYVKLGNPWGFDQPGLIPLAQLSKGIVEVDVGMA